VSRSLKVRKAKSDEIEKTILFLKRKETWHVVSLQMGYKDHVVEMDTLDRTCMCYMVNGRELQGGIG